MVAAFAASVDRRRVLVLGDPPPDEPFLERELSLAAFEAGIDTLRWSRALVVRVDNDIDINKRELTLALDHGLQVIVFATSDEDERAAIEQLDAFGLQKAVTLRTRVPWYDIAERCRNHDPKSGIGDVEIIGECDEDDAFLLRRAFADCTSVSVAPLTPGLSGAKVLRVHATFADSAAGPRPLPFFAKTDTIQRIEKEIQNYRQYVDRFIPFYLRPHLDEARCLNSQSRGLLVGDFVANSEPLLATLRANRGRSALNSLFDESLRSWRLQAFDSERGQVSGKVPAALYQFEPDRFPGDRVREARSNGAQCDPAELVRRLLSVPAIAFRSGPIHADLSCSNVQVRLNDAILIDFYTTQIGPIAADPAALEVDVAFSYDTRSDYVEWRDIVHKLFRTTDIPLPSGLPTSREWLWEAVRQIRMHGRACSEPREYELALAVYLLKRAQYETHEPADEQRRVFAYVLADGLIRGLQ